jgi:hypothetical protein
VVRPFGYLVVGVLTSFLFFLGNGIEVTENGKQKTENGKLKRECSWLYVKVLAGPDWVVAVKGGSADV